jgi:hypothetical protein
MTQKSLSRVLEFISGAALPAPPSGTNVLRAGDAPSDAAAHLAAVVGSSILTFEESVPTARRAAVLNSGLLAQLVANREVPGQADVDKWYDSYFSTLSELGFATQERSFTQVRSADSDFSAHSAILAVAAAFLGETTSAYVLFVKALSALRQMDPDSEWIRIFRRETRSEKTAKIQMGAVTGAGGDLVVSSMAFELNSNTDITQILFFKSKQANVTFRESHGKTSIDAAILDAIQPALQKKLLSRAANFIFGLPDL